MNSQGSFAARWRRRRSTPFKRVLWTLVFLAGFVAAAVLFKDWVESSRPKDVENFRPAYLVVLSALYWAVPVALWGFLYPADGRRLLAAISADDVTPAAGSRPPG